MGDTFYHLPAALKSNLILQIMPMSVNGAVVLMADGIQRLLSLRIQYGLVRAVHQAQHTAIE